MAQDDPADTAGPSSPPPRLPEGWLPQWEGVQRQWYFVQRATGKSQWEIPTEAVILSPSPAPTSIGTSPSQAPTTRQSANSPNAFGPRGLDERFNVAVEEMRYFGSRDAQVGGQSLYPSYGPSQPNPYSGQFSHPSGGHFGQPVGAESSEYVLPGAPGQVDSNYSALYPDQGHPVQQIHQNHPPQSGFAPSSQPFFGTYPAPDAIQPVDRGFVPHHTQNYGSHSNRSEYIGHLPGSQGIGDPIRPDFGQYTHQIEAFERHSAPNSRQSKATQCHQNYGSSNTAQLFMHPYSSGSVAQGRYESTSMGRTQSGPDMKPLGFPATTETQRDAQNYQNPLVQAALQQYLPQRHSLHATRGNDPRGAGQPHQVSTPSSSRKQWTGTNTSLRSAASDPQFVSGPWASSTPPTHVPPQPPRYG